MNDQQIEDLRQFIDGRISQAEARIDESIYGKIDNLEVNLTNKIEDLRQEMLDGFSGVGEAIDEINKHFDERLSRLEQQAP